MKTFILSLLLFATTQAWALYDESPHSISGAIGFAAPGANVMSGTGSNGAPSTPSFVLSGLLGIGADYDYNKTKDISFGGFLRYYTVSSNYASTTFKNTLFALGPDVKGYLQNDTWLGYMGAGLSYMAPSYTGNSNDVSISSGIGLMMSIGLMYKVSSTMSFGLESLRLIGLSNSINGVPVEDFMLKGRFQL